jgi:hypothetical protein
MCMHDPLYRLNCTALIPSLIYLCMRKSLGEYSGLRPLRLRVLAGFSSSSDHIRGV